MNTTENNKLIGEFIGMFLPLNLVKIEELQFHADWNRLMKVVEKINLLDGFKYSVTIQTMDCYISDNKGEKIVSIDCKYNVDELKKSVYYACVEFIKWHNEQTKTI